MKSGLLEIEHLLSESSREPKSRSVEAGLPIFRNVRQATLLVARLVTAIATYRALVNELDGLTDADIRDLGIHLKDAASVAWTEAWLRAAKRYGP